MSASLTLIYIEILMLKFENVFPVPLSSVLATSTLALCTDQPISPVPALTPAIAKIAGTTRIISMSQRPQPPPKPRSERPKSTIASRKLRQKRSTGDPDQVTVLEKKPSDRRIPRSTVLREGRPLSSDSSDDESSDDESSDKESSDDESSDEESSDESTDDDSGSNSSRESSPSGAEKKKKTEKKKQNRQLITAPSQRKSTQGSAQL